VAIKAFPKKGHWHKAMNQSSARIIQIDCEKNANGPSTHLAKKTADIKKPPAL
jgi:hypothetical protein